MIINNDTLFMMAPVTPMAGSKKKGDIVSYGLTEAGYDIRIKEDIFFNPGKRWFFKDKPTVSTLTEDTPGNFILASSIEHFTMPRHTVGVVYNKSSWARRGINVFTTVIEPGWHGYLTLEISFHNVNEYVHIPAGSGIAQVLFESLTHEADYAGKYQNQEAGPQKAR